ncbi:MAG: hypothetical protein ACK4YL_15875 [Microcystis sp.]|nr:MULTISPECIES: hypothetical protein [unclassified Microcystis]MCE2667658.1 hypothetical protein [Microcystis sp. 49638_E5]MCZ8054355.1 hypothetical protein [Microcystis sp. LE19-12.2C]MDJ0548623.1 hypothetical protein [Microcystis sp. M49637_WE12]MDJ0583470.1 hypothetical protein [Microcystis sp. M49636_WE2]
MPQTLNNSIKLAWLVLFASNKTGSEFFVHKLLIFVSLNSLEARCLIGFDVRIQAIQKAVKLMLCKHLGELCPNPHSHSETLKALIFVLIENETVSLASSEILEAAL